MPSAFCPAVGGVEELTAQLARALQREGDLVEVWAPLYSHLELPTQENWGGLTIRRFPMPLPPAKLSHVATAVPTSARGLRELGRAVAAFNPDVLHVQCFGPNGAYATTLSALSGVPLVVTLQGETTMDDHDIYEHSRTLQVALRLAFRRAAAVTACSAFTLADAQRFGLAPAMGRVIYNGVAMNEECDTDGAPLPTNDFVVTPPFARYVLGLGRVVKKKGFDLLIRAFARLGAPDDVGLVIGGEGAALVELRRLVSDLGLDGRVWFPGRLARDKVAQLMKGAELFVMPSRVEPFGIVVLEAWRAGTPVVATARGGPPEFVEEGVNGLLVDPLDTTALSDAMASLLQDPERQAELGRAGRDKAALFSWDVIAKHYRSVYIDASSKRRRR